MLQIAVPRSMLGMTGQKIDFNFKWSDNMQEDGNILDFYSNGDVAPGGRFMFIATTDDVKDVPPLREESSNHTSNNSANKPSVGDSDNSDNNDGEESNGGLNWSKMNDIIIVASVCVVSISLIFIMLVIAIVIRRRKNAVSDVPNVISLDEKSAENTVDEESNT